MNQYLLKAGAAANDRNDKITITEVYFLHIQSGERQAKC